ncbi:MAG: type II secretion system protein GspC [Desulfatiglandaceae bacterium]
MGVELFYGGILSSINDVQPKYELAYSESRDSVLETRTQESYDVITKRNLFGSVDQVAGVEEVQEEEFKDIELTTLKISLLGTVSGDDNTGYAVIEEAAGKKQGLFRVGDSVQNAVVERIRRGEVILNIGGKYEKLTMDEAAQARAALRNEDVAPVVEDVSTIPVSSEMVENSLGNINQLLTQVRVRPHFSDGLPDGLVLSHIRQDSIFGHLGLKNGDVVKGVDGREIKSPNDILSFYNSLKSGSDISVDVMRRGRLQTLRYSFR